MCKMYDFINKMILLTIVILFILQIYMSVEGYQSYYIVIVMSVIIFLNSLIQCRISRRREEDVMTLLDGIEPSIDLKTIRVQKV